MNVPFPPDTTARLTALVEAANANAELAAGRAHRADEVERALRAAGITGWESVRRAALRALAAVHREAERTEDAARRATELLLAHRAGVGVPSAVPRIADGCRQAAVALAAATGSLGRAGRLVAGLAACLAGHPGAAALWREAWVVLLTVDVGEVPSGRVRQPRSRADAQAELAGVVAHLDAMAPAFVTVEVAAPGHRYVQAYADKGVLRVESVANEFLERPHRLSRAQTGALEAAGLEPPDAHSPNWHLALHGAPPQVAAALLVHLLELHDPGLRSGFRIRTVADERDLAPLRHTPGCPAAGPATPPHLLSAPDDGDPGDLEPGTVVEGIAGPMLVVAGPGDPDGLAAALAEVVEPWLPVVGWGGLNVVVDQPTCPFAVEVTPAQGWALARLLPYLEAPGDVEAALVELGWFEQDQAEQRWWVQPFDPAAGAVAVLEVVVETLHAVCGLELDRPVLVQVAPA